MACGVCRLVLNGRVVDGVRTYTHTLDEGHEAVPVPVDDIHTEFVCDFCLASGARWVIPTESYEVTAGAKSVGDWMACDDCASDVRRRRWSSVVTRSRRARQDRQGSAPPRAVFEVMYQQVETHMTGPVRLYQPPSEPA